MGCADADDGTLTQPAARADLPTLTTSGWFGANRDRLDAMITALGRRSPTWDASDRPVVVFDWDNTVTKNDTD